MNYLYHFAASGLEVFAAGCVLCILREQYWNILKLVSITLISAGITTFLDVWKIEINIGINLLLLAVLVFLFYRSKILECVFDVVCASMIVIISQMITSVILRYINLSILKSKESILLYLGILAAIFFVILRILQKSLFVKYYQKYQNGIWIVCFNFVFIQLAEMYNWNSTETINISIAVLVLVAVTSNLILAFKLVKNQRQKEELNKQKELMKLKEAFLQEMAAEQHDFTKHLRTIKALLETGESKETNSELKSYVEELIADRGERRSLMYSGDGVLSAVLYDKQKEAEQKGITFHVLTKGTEKKPPLSPTETAELVGNLLDNAFEAVESMEPGKRKVFFETGTQKGAAFFQTINPLPEDSLETDQMLENGVSTKRGPLRGYGLANVKRTAEARGGRLEIRKDDEIIVIRLLFQ